MYSDKRNILQLVALLKAYGVHDIVLCPGSRNAPIVHTLVQAEGFRCHPVTDERNAGFVAIGLSLATREAAAVCCTSGSALANLHPAVAEAFYRNIPLVVISADRPAAWIGQMDGQTMPQPGIFGPLVKCSVNLPEIRTDEDEWYCNRLLNEALLKATLHGGGPVHINVPLSNPLYRFTADALPAPRVIRYLDGRSGGLPPQLHGTLRQCAGRMVVVGQLPHAPGNDSPALCEGYVRLAEHPGNRNNPAYIGNFDVLLSGRSPEELEALRPGLLITCGGHIVSGRLKSFLRTHPPRFHWHVSPDGTVADTFGCLTLVVEDDPEDFLRRLPAFDGEDSREYTHRWQVFSAGIPVPRLPFSAPAVVGDLLANLPAQSVLHLANSSALRYAQLFPLAPEKRIEVQCNRGVNGIEGSLPCAVGYAAASDKLNIVLIGDLSFFYGMNALCQPGIRPNLRILLLNNFGGSIFHTLPGMPEGGSARFIMGDHRVTAAGWAESCGFRYLSVADGAEWEAACRQLTSPCPQPHPLLVEVFTRKEEDAAVLGSCYG